MKRTILTIGSIVALAAAPAWADPGSGGHGGGNGGGGGGMGGGMGHSMGAGPPMTAPGQTSNPRGAAADIAAQRGQFGRDLAQQQQQIRADDVRRYQSTLDRYEAKSKSRRDEALAEAAEAKAGRGKSLTAKDVRDELRDDMDEWRDTFNVGRDTWQQQRDQWLAERDGMTAADWAERRAAWFAARDNWIAQQTDWAKSHGGDTTGD